MWWKNIDRNKRTIEVAETRMMITECVYVRVCACAHTQAHVHGHTCAYLLFEK